MGIFKVERGKFWNLLISLFVGVGEGVFVFLGFLFVFSCGCLNVCLFVFVSRCAFVCF